MANNDSKNDLTGAILAEFSHFINTVKKLRSPNGGCPWDREQTHHSLVPYLLEESFELAEAIERAPSANFARPSGPSPREADLHIIEELGDVLLQVVLHAQIASETGRFTMADISRAVNEKMIRRHPHVFGENAAEEFAGITAAQVLSNWQVIKSQEKISATELSGQDLAAPPIQNQENPKGVSFHFNVPLALPALQRSAKLGEKTKKRRFDWPDWRGALSKVDEEMAELKRALDESPATVHVAKEYSETGTSNDPVESEIGDLLFTVAQLARHRGIDPEQALRETNARFERRFGVLQELAKDLEKKDGRGWDSRSQAEIETLWQKAKAILREAGKD